MRWLLPVVLAVAVSGMHHLPARAGGDTHHSVSDSPALVSVPPVPEHGREHDEAVLCCQWPPGAVSTVPRDGGPAGHGTGHELLHLCLAVLVAALASLLIFAAPGRYPSANEPARAAVLPPEALARPPPCVPISRRLAVLGVLRL